MPVSAGDAGRLEPPFLPVMCDGGLILVLLVSAAAYFLWSLHFHVLIFGYHLAVETTTVLCLPLLWLPANQCLLWQIICGGVSWLVPLLWLLDVCVVAIDCRGKPFELREGEKKEENK